MEWKHHFLQRQCSLVQPFEMHDTQTVQAHPLMPIFPVKIFKRHELISLPPPPTEHMIIGMTTNAETIPLYQSKSYITMNHGKPSLGIVAVWLRFSGSVTSLWNQVTINIQKFQLLTCPRRRKCRNGYIDKAEIGLKKPLSHELVLRWYSLIFLISLSLSQIRKKYLWWCHWRRNLGKIFEYIYNC